MSYPIKLLITSIIASLGLYLWNQFMPAEYNNLHVYFILPFFIIFSLLSFQSLTKTLDSENKNAFTMRFMASTGIKMFVCLIVIVVYAFINKTQITSFAVLFLFLYFLFTALETASLFKEIQKRKQNN